MRNPTWPDRLVLLVALLSASCARSPADPANASSDVTAAPAMHCEAGVAGGRLPPGDGVWLGVNLDWVRDTPAAYGLRVGRHPAVFTSFTPLPIDATHAGYLDAAVGMLQQAGGMLLLTVEPHSGLGDVTPAVAEQLALRLAGYNARGVPVMLRFAHEMNGSWYAWSQQPAAYIEAFRAVANAVHRLAPGSAMLWAPNYGGGYPFRGGRYLATDGSDLRALDSNGDGRLDGLDDPYASYYPGDDVVDWVGVSLYHWGAAYPWGSNVLPEPGKFAAMLSGEYDGSAGDERGLPDFYREYGERRGKPVGIFETAALYAPGRGGADELALKSAWWSQVFDDDIPQRFPNLKLINWFEWDKHEVEINGRVDWG
ncbi:MAG TPA: glycosyl hydrolase, partial [Arenimonas sp.]|nr:glycosyl hydrolase [Arenimonas sp.]